MLDYHSQELWDIRTHAYSRKFLLLESYAYLRDAAVKSFFHESLTSALWKRVDDLSCRPAASTGRPVTNNLSRPRCSHCLSKEAHEALGVSPKRNECPFTKLAVAKARAAAKELVVAMVEDPKLDVSAKVKSLCNHAHK
jgi:hypothetical protein